MTDRPLLGFDNNATTSAAPEVVDAMLPWLRAEWGNPSSTHRAGARAAEAVAAARAAVARLLGVGSPNEVLFTSGGTESLNLAIHSATATAAERGAPRRVVTTTAEHSAVARPVEALEAEGWSVERIGVDGEGRLDVDAFVAAVREGDPALATVLWANNETGVVVPRVELARLGEACRDAGVPLLVDAIQAAGKLPLALGDLPVDYAALSAHKFHGPKGVGALWVRSGAPFRPLLRGGPQERERRGGTENVPGIVGLGRAAELAAAHATDPDATARVAALRDRLETALLAGVPDARIHGAAAERVANTSSVAFLGVSGEALLLLASEEGLCVSTGSACDAAHAGPSPVLLAMGCGEEEANATLRFSLSRETRTEEVEAAAGIAIGAVEVLRALAAPG